jgi:hypothetical protein
MPDTTELSRRRSRDHDDADKAFEGDDEAKPVCCWMKVEGLEGIESAEREVEAPQKLVW